MPKSKKSKPTKGKTTDKIHNHINIIIGNEKKNTKSKRKRRGGGGAGAGFTSIAPSIILQQPTNRPQYLDTNTSGQRSLFNQFSQSEMAIPNTNIRHNNPVVFENQEPRSVSMNDFNDGIPSTGGLSIPPLPSSAGGGVGVHEEEGDDRIINPKTGRLIKMTGKAYKDYQKRMDEEDIKNKNKKNL